MKEVTLRSPTTWLLALVLSLSGCSSEKEQRAESPQIATAAKTVGAPAALTEQIPAGTKRLERFNPAKLNTLASEFPLLRTTNRHEALQSLLKQMTSGRVRTQDPKLLPSMRRDQDYWLMHVYKLDDAMLAFAEHGAPYEAKVFAGTALRALLPSDAPKQLESEINTLCAQRGKCPAIIGMAPLEGYLRVDIEIKTPGVALPAPEALKKTPYPPLITPAYESFWEKGLSYASYETIVDMHTRQSITKLGEGFTTWGPAPTILSEPSYTPQDTYYDYALRIVQDEAGVHGDVQRTYSPAGKALAEKTQVEASLPDIAVHDPIIKVEWASELSAFGALESKRKDRRVDVSSHEEVWASSPMFAASYSNLGHALEQMKPFLRQGEMLGLRIAIEQVDDSGRLNGAALFLTENLDGKPKLRESFTRGAKAIVQALGKANPPELRNVGGRQLHIFKFGNTDLDKLLGPNRPVGSLNATVDMGRATLSMAGSLKLAGQGGPASKNKLLEIKQTEHKNGSSTYVHFGRSHTPREWKWNEEPAPTSEVSACVRDTVNGAQQAYYRVQLLRENKEEALRAIRTHIEWLKMHPCKDLPDLERAWSTYRDRFEAGDAKSPEFGLEAFCNISEVCEVPAGATQGDRQRILAGCIIERYPNSMATNALSIAERSGPQARELLLLEQRKAKLATCPAIDIFAPSN